MKLLACLKGVPKSMPRLRGGALEYDTRALVMNECDEYALEMALSFKRQTGGEVTAVTVGPVGTQDVLYVALAKGANRAIRISEEANTAEILAQLARQHDVDLVLAGVEALDDLAGQVAPSIAAFLDLPFACAVGSVELESDATTVTVTREMGGGFTQVLHMSLPAVLAVPPGICGLSYASVRGIMHARRRPIEVASPGELGVVPTQRPSVPAVEIVQPLREREAQMITGSVEEIARTVLDRTEEALRS